jgi:hypothetical protein
VPLDQNEGWVPNGRGRRIQFKECKIIGLTYRFLVICGELSLRPSFLARSR